MGIIDSCIIQQDSILETGVCLRQSSSTLSICSTACIRQDISAAAAWFCNCKLLSRSDERVLLPCFNAQPDIFAVMNCCVVALSLFSSDILTWSADSYIQCSDTYNELRQNVDLETCIWRQIVTSQTAHTKCKWPPYSAEWNLLPLKIFCARQCPSMAVDLPVWHSHWIKARFTVSVSCSDELAVHLSVMPGYFAKTCK